MEALAGTLDKIHDWDKTQTDGHAFGLSDELARKCCEAIRKHLDIDGGSARYFRASHFGHLVSQVRQYRDSLWKEILERRTPERRTNAQVIFDISQDLEELCPFLRDRRLAFLLDDYSNQRIPAALQKRLNQSITFAKQGAPIFKVSSEYYGVDLEGIHEGREVMEVNVGFEYVSLKGQERWSFLKTVLERRFAYLNQEVDLAKVLSFSNVQPAIDMAKRIKECVDSRRRFHYFGLDTISDVCSGDFAMGLDLVRRVFEHGHVNWIAPRPIEPEIQDEAIREYASREFEYIRYRSTEGLRKYEIIDRLCWLSRQCILHRTREKDGKDVPMLKNHLDISERALQDLDKFSPEQYQLLHDLIRNGVLFPLQTSRSRESHEGTRRYMVRRILLTRHGVPLGRDTAIKIDHVERLRTLITEPREFAERELESAGARQRTRAASMPSPDQRRLPTMEDCE